MNGSPVKILRNNGKTINPQDLPPEAWQVVFGKSSDTADLQDYFQHVSWCFRGVDIRGNALSSVPFVIEDLSGDTIDESGQYENVVGFLPEPEALFALVEMALTVFGYAYLYQQPNILNTKTWGLRYLLPTDIVPEWAKNPSGQVTGLGGFKRRKLNKTLSLEETVYFWRRDPFVEFGPPASSPLMAAAAEAGVILNVNRFAALFFERGAIKATLLAVHGNPGEPEKERIKSMWGRLMNGIRTVFGELVINAESLKPIVVGEGLEALSDKNLTNEKREGIATALGIPHSILFSGSASGLGGGGVAEQDEATLYKQTIIPDCKFIAGVLNKQLFVPMGYRLRFTPENMDIFQEDEEQRALAMSQFMDTVDKAGSFDMFKALIRIYGIEVDDEALALVEKHYAGKAERAAAMQSQLSQRPNTEQKQPDVKPPENNQGSDNPENKRTDLDRWRDKAVKALKSGKSAAVVFDSNEITPVLQGAIAGALESVTSTEEVHRVFLDAWLGYP